MPPPKPSQRGKFRPKKPQKKYSKPPTTTVATGKPVSVQSELSVDRGEDLNLKKDDSAVAERGERGRGRGGRGRGGRGGRGRIPIPQGTVFFTGGEKQVDSSTKGSIAKRADTPASVSRISRKRNETKRKDGRDSMDTSTEEVVGQLDTAIGGSGNKKKESILERDFGDYHDDEGPSDEVGGSTKMNISAGCTYDSDSSEEKSNMQSKNMSLMAPLELPFFFKSKSVEAKPDLTRSILIDEHIDAKDPEYDEEFSLLADTDKVKDVRNENHAWVLVQLPTRLPPMQKEFSGDEIDRDDTEEYERREQVITNNSTSSSTNDGLLNNLSEVAVPPVSTSYFDYGLHKTVPGKIGKLVFYKSGKTVLVMDGPDDKVTMNVNKGLTCAFHQHIVAVNVKEGHYIILGDVTKSIVVSPDLIGI